jgi:hypothetical protein
MASGVHVLVADEKISALPKSSPTEGGVLDAVLKIAKRQSPIAKPGTERRKNVPGAFAQEKGHRAERACRRVGKALRPLVAFRGRHGLRIASRERVEGILRRIAHGKSQMAKGAA